MLYLLQKEILYHQIPKQKAKKLVLVQASFTSITEASKVIDSNG